MKPTGLILYGFAKPDGGVNPGRDDYWRVYQLMRQLGLLIPTVQMTYQNSTLSWRPTTDDWWDQNDAKNYSFTNQVGNADENGNKNGWDWEGGAQWRVLCPPRLNETLYGAADPIEGGFLRSIRPANDDNLPYNPVTGQIDWQAAEVKLRQDVNFFMWEPGRRPEGRADADGNFAAYNAGYWFEVHLRQTAHPFSLLSQEWYWQIIETNPEPNPILGAPIGRCFREYATTEIPKATSGHGAKFDVLGDPQDPDSGILVGTPVWPRVVAA